MLCHFACAYLAGRLDAIFARLGRRQEAIVLRAGVLLEAGTVVGQTERIGHLGQEVLLGETAQHDRRWKNEELI